MIKVVSKGDFKKTKKFLGFVEKRRQFSSLNRYGKMGVDALADATPVDSGKTAQSWEYEIVERDGSLSIIWTNSNTTDRGIPIVVLLQYGHATKDGYFIQGVDFINPALKPIFDDIAESIWQEVTNA